MIGAVLIALLAADPAPRDPVEGRWCWFNDQLITVGPHGVAVSAQGARGEWKVDAGAPNSYRFAWDNGRYVDHLTLSGDGMKGTNSLGSIVHARRTVDRVVGSYAWRDKTIVTLAEGGAASSSDGRKGTWALTDAIKALYRVTWSADEDELTLVPHEDLMLAPDRVTLLGEDWKPAAHRLPVPFVGTWALANDLEIWVRADGSFTDRDPTRVRGAWRVLDAAKRTYQLDWSTRRLDDVTLSADHLALAGTSDDGAPVRARRNKADPVVGTWTWLGNKKVTVGADGSLRVGNAKRGPWDGWQVVDADARTYLFSSENGARIDRMTLSASGAKLEGQDGVGSPVVATRVGKPPRSAP